MVDEVQKNGFTDSGMLTCVSHKVIPLLIGALGIGPSLLLLSLSFFFTSDSSIQWVAVFGTLLAALYSIWLWYDHSYRSKVLKWLKIEHSLVFTNQEKK
jgi:hypothetical protein